MSRFIPSSVLLSLAIALSASPCSHAAQGTAPKGLRKLDVFDYHGVTLDGGKAEVRIDGKVVAIVDQYGPGRNLPFEWSQKNLALGPHSIRLRLLDEKLPQSKDRFINVAGFECLVCKSVQ